MPIFEIRFTTEPYKNTLFFMKFLNDVHEEENLVQANCS